MPSLILHAGFHKTGTSAIQRFAASHRRLLASKGLIYPRLWPASFRPVDGHHFIAHAVAGNERFLTGSQASALVGRWRRTAEWRRMSVILSSEAICRLSAPGKGDTQARQEAYLRRLRNVLACFDVTPVLVLRRQDDFVRSLYQEHVMDGLSSSASLPFDAFLRDRAADKPQFLARLQVFQSVFQKVRVLVYEDLQARGLISAFFEACGVDLPPLQQAGVVRPSLSPAQTLIKQRLNPFIKNRWKNQLLLRWLNSDGVKHTINEVLDECECIWPSREVRRQFVKQFDEENRAIGRVFLRGEVQPFPAFAAAEVRPPPPSSSLVDEALSELARRYRRRLAVIIGRDSVSRLVGHD